MNKHFITWFLEKTRPFVWAVAEAYQLKIERAGFAYGQHLLTFKGGEDQIRGQVPRSCYFNTRSGAITIGDETVFGEDVKVLTGKHASVAESESLHVPLHHVPEGGRDIVIGNGCYIGSFAIIIGPVTIGDYAVVGAGAVVTKDVPSRTFVAGNPARMIREF